MVRMSTVWDRTTEVLSGRGGALARIAALGVFLPSVVRAAFAAYAGGPPATPGLVLIGALVSLLVLVILIWAQLALIALSSDPATTPAAAASIATRRLGAALAVVLVLGIIFLLLLAPLVVALSVTLIGDSPTVAAEMIRAGTMPRISSGAALFLLIYILAFAIFAIFISARLAVTNAVVVNERLGLGAIRRSFALTRGSTWRIIGVLILYAIVLFVATLAAQSIVGVIVGLILGRGAAATVAFLAAVAASAVTAALTVVAAAFVAQLYVAARAVSGAPSGT